MSESGILYERLELLERSRRGHLASITRVCNELDESLKDFSNVVKVRTLQTQLNTAHVVINMLICLIPPVRNIKVF